MDGKRFDDLARSTANRRGLIKGISGAVAGFAGLQISNVLAACRPGNYACQRNTDCCSGVCYYPSKTARSRVCCTADPVEVTCGDSCGTVTNNCGLPVVCECCVPDSDETTCANACGIVTNNCGIDVDCGCCADPVEVTCANQCGTVTNNCGDNVECEACCVPDADDVICADFCGTKPNNCGIDVICGCGDLDCCGETCVDTSTNPENCGECDKVCEGGPCIDSQCCVPESYDETCADSCGVTVVNNCNFSVECKCGENLDCCGEICVDTSMDNDNCGACGNACADDESCVDSECEPPLLPDGSVCSSNEQCQNWCTCGGNADAGVCASSFFQDFSTGTAGWNVVTWNSGNAIVAPASASFSRLGGYTNVFPTNGWETKLDIYLNMANNSVLGTSLRVDYSVAHNDPSCLHRRDFVFNIGTDPVTIGQFLIGASSNAGEDPALHNPVMVNATGWYTFTHTFTNDGGALHVARSVSGPGGSGNWAETIAVDTIGGTIGGHRYAEFFNNAFSDLLIDNSSRYDL